MATVVINDISMYYKTFFKGKEVLTHIPIMPTLIVLHGGPGIVDHQIEEKFWSVFSETVQVILPDQRGCGKTDDGDPEKWNLTQCGQDIAEFTKALNLTNYAIAGISWGGYVMMSYIEQYFPSKSRGIFYPKGFIFCSTEAKVSPEARKDMFLSIGQFRALKQPLANPNVIQESQRAAEAAMTHDTAPTLDSTLNYFEKCGKFFSQTPFEFIQPTRTNMDMRLKFTKVENLTLNYLHVLKKIDVPCLLLTGELDPAHPPSGAEEMFQNIPKSFASLHILKSGAPAYQDDQKTAVKLINTFLDAYLKLGV